MTLARQRHIRRTGGLTVADSWTPRLFLKTFGTAALLAPRAATGGLRHKDLALLIYLRLEAARPVSRSVLATLLWGDGLEHGARHSLSQTLRRLRWVVGADMLALDRDSVQWVGALPCDAALLEDDADGDTVSRLYAGDFVAALGLGSGADDFEAWADAKRAQYRLRAVQLLERCAGEAERRGEPERALGLSLRAVEIEPLFQAGHRCVMRAWNALGERAFALRHYHALERTLRMEVGTLPDPCTRALAAQLCEQEA